ELRCCTGCIEELYNLPRNASLVLFRSSVTGFFGFLFGHVLALLGLTVPAGPGLVVDTGVGVHPDGALGVGRRRWIRCTFGRTASGGGSGGRWSAGGCWLRGRSGV